MKINFDDFKPLADLLLEKGVPMLANAFLPGIGGAVAGAVMPSLAQAFGLNSDAAPEDVSKAIQADPDADTKLKALEDRHTELLDFAQKAIDANQAELTLEPSFLGRLFVGGWRPAMGWLGVAVVGREVGFYALIKAPLPFETLSLIVGLWCALAGVRSVEMVRGAARTSLSAVAKKVVKRG